MWWFFAIFSITIDTVGTDVLLQITCKLGTFDVARLARTCSAFRCLLACPDARRFLKRYHEKCELLGALVSCSPLSRYPVLLSSLLPNQQSQVEMFSAFWRNFAASNKLQKLLVLDCRDGRILLREGNRLSKKLIVCNPFAANNTTRVVPELPSDLNEEAASYVSGTFIPDDDGSNFSIIVLMETEQASGSSPIRIGQYMSNKRSWRCKKSMWESEVQLKTTIRLPSVLSDKKVLYLQPGVQILAVDTELNIDRIPIPAITAVAVQNHLLVQRRSGIPCLVVITKRKVCLFEFISSCTTWHLSKEFEGPGDETDCRLVGSGNEKILIHAADRLCCMDLIDGRCFDVSIGSKFIRGAFCYELQYPPVAEFLRRLK